MIHLMGISGSHTQASSAVPPVAGSYGRDSRRDGGGLAGDLRLA